MHVGAGAAAITVGMGLSALLVFGVWRRVPAVVAYGLAAVLGALVGAGALLVQDEPGRADWLVVLAGFAMLAPIHHRFLVGQPGRRA